MSQIFGLLYLEFEIVDVVRLVLNDLIDGIFVLEGHEGIAEVRKGMITFALRDGTREDFAVLFEVVGQTVVGQLLNGAANEYPLDGLLQFERGKATLALQLVSVDRMRPFAHEDVDARSVLKLQERLAFVLGQIALQHGTVARGVLLQLLCRCTLRQIEDEDLTFQG